MSKCEDKTISYYNSHSSEFQKSVQSADMKKTCDQFLSCFSSPAYILDLGCGTGRDSRYFRDCGHSVLPVDASEEMCRIATEVSGITAQKLKFDELDFVEKFDGVWACASLLHVERSKMPEILKKINRAIKPEGILYMSFKYGTLSEERDGRFFTDMTEEDLPFLCNANTGFDLLECSISSDVRPDRCGEKWLNIFAKKY